jgi:hypothetical protein
LDEFKKFDYQLRNGAGQAITEADGFFDFAGLLPGTYTAEVSPGQLERPHLICRPWTLPFKISPKKVATSPKDLNSSSNPTRLSLRVIGSNGCAQIYNLWLSSI